MIWLILVLVVLFLFYYGQIKPQLYWKSRNVDQGFPKPFLGDNLWNFLRLESSIDMVGNVYNRNKNCRYTGLYQGNLPILLLRDPELIKKVTVKDFEHFMDHRSFSTPDTEPIWSKNLFSLKGDLWKEMRSTLSPTFTTSKMRTMFSLMEESARQYVNFYLEQNKNVIELELKDSFTRYANDVIANCAFGLTVDSLKEPNNEFYQQGAEVTNFKGFIRNLRFMITLMSPTLTKIFKISLFPSGTTTFFKKIVRDTLRIREEKNIIRPDMINLLIEARNGKLKFEETQEQGSGFATVQESELGRKAHLMKSEMTDDDITAQVLIFFFAGFDTISTMMSFMCYELAINSEVQERLRNEVDATREKCKGKLIYDELNKMKYMDMVISESMRKHSPVLAMDRMCTKPYTIEPQLPGEQPLRLEAGDWIWIPMSAIHHNQEFYPNPEKFDPERFSDENKGTIQPYTYMPFGSGPRNCIGSRFALMECKALVYHILSKFELIVIDKTTIPIKLSKSQFNPYVQGGFWVGLKKRSL